MTLSIHGRQNELGEVVCQTPKDIINAAVNNDSIYIKGGEHVGYVSFDARINNAGNGF